MKRVIFESASEFVIVCLVVGFAYAAIQYYRNKHQPWANSLNWLLFGLRAALATFLCFLLMGPIVKQIKNLYEKPQFVFLYDNSASITHTTDSLTLKALQEDLANLKASLEEKGFATTSFDLNGETEKINYNVTSSDINSGIRHISNRYEGQNIGGVVLVSDGIYNAGLSPLYSSYNFPIHTIGIGDTSVRMDVGIKNLAYNKIAYQGNKFPLRAEVQVKNLAPQNITVKISRRGRVIEQQTRKTKGDDELLSFDFQSLAEEQGIQKIDVDVEVKPGEANVRNNHASAYVEVVEGKKKILLVAPAPHPDIKALREVVEKNSNYDFILHIPGISEQQGADLRPEKIDLAIFHQSPDIRGRTTQLFQTFAKAKTSILIVFGQQTDLRELAKYTLPVKYDGAPREFDEVTPVLNPMLPNFSISTEANSSIATYPPSSVHFGKFQTLPNTNTVLFQRVGNVTTDKPLLAVQTADDKKIGVMLGDGFWRWRLNEFERTENSAAFDELFGKVIQFLSTNEDKRKFRSYPIRQEFNDSEAVIFESQVYNDIFEPVYGNNIEIQITDESGRKREFSYVTSPGNVRYQIGGLPEGIYKYRSTTVLNNKTEEARGEFAVVHQDAELQNLTADFDLLRRVSQNTGGKFYERSKVSQLINDLENQQAKAIIHSEESYDSLLNLKWIFFALLILVTGEWFLRKFYGSY
jgi:hypothetical protein